LQCLYQTAFLNRNLDYLIPWHEPRLELGCRDKKKKKKKKKKKRGKVA
jgi:hypothetical protein